ncbi:MAG: chemotaxis protein CheB [Planctomycetota bacterium]
MINDERGQIPTAAEVESGRDHDLHETDSSPFYIVGVGASAGGLEALELLFSSISEESGMAFVVVQHLSPDFKSLMVELLARHTRMKIKRVENGMVVEPNTVYLLPPKQEMIIQGGKLLLRERVGDGNLSLPIDRFFRSLARDQGPMGISVVLSGTGSDGSRGLVDVHLAGGLVIAQQPETCKFDGMPKTAIGTGMVDAIAAPDEISDLLKKYISHPFASDLQRSKVDPNSVERIYELIQKRHGIDFAEYKPATIGRRIERRISLNDDADLNQYISRLEADEDELDQLFSDFLIGVTSFFRDPEAYSELEDKVLPELLARHDPETDFRGWIAGCATGEEAYSIAICIHEILRRADKAIPIKIFATDLHRDALGIAHAGIYTEDAVREMSSDLIDRYFTRVGENYQICSQIRDCIVFAPHNVVTDTPFTNLDLVCCRNVLIYFRSLVQRKVLSLFHFSLRKGGVLFLGASESPGELSDEFSVLSERWKLFKKLRDSQNMPSGQTRFRPSVSIRNQARGQSLSRAIDTTATRLATLYDRLLERYMPAAILLDSAKHVLHVFGGAGRYLNYTDGRLSTNILDLVHGDLHLALAGGLQRVIRQDKPIIYPAIQAFDGDQMVVIKVEINSVVTKANTDPSFLVTLTPLEQADSAEQAFSGEAINLDEATMNRMSDLEAELRYTKEDLQATIEELETSNEELQATNEEMVASNEELQSTNEELHSVNEELYTVNAEYQKKITELTTLTNDMDNLFVSTEVHTLFLDANLEIRRFTPKMAEVFNLLPQDIGRRIGAFSHSIVCDNLVQKIDSVLAEGNTYEEKLQDKRGQHFLMRVLPYRVRGATTGAVLTLIDIGSLIEAQEGILRERERFERAIAANRDGIWDWPNLNQDDMWWSPTCWTMLGYESDELEPKHSTWLSLIHPDDRRLVEQTSLPMQNECYVEIHRDFEYRMMHKSGVYRWYRHRAMVDRDDNGRPIRMTGSVGDIHDRKQAEIQTVEATEAIERRDRFLAMLSHELRNPMSAVLNSVGFIDTIKERKASGIPTESSSEQRTEHAFQIIQHQTKHMGRLLEDLLDVSRFGHQKIGFKKEVIDLIANTHDVQRAVEHLFEDKHQTLHIDIEAGPIPVLADQARLKQAQVNLLTNASKYTPDGGEIWYSIAKTSSSKVEIVVRDNGDGIPAELQDQIFDLFVQSESTLARSSGGMGVGLSLAKQIIDAHGGNVTVASDGPNTGSTFTIELPLTDSPIAAKSSHMNSVMPTGMKILIVEDNIDAGDMLGETLALQGNEVQMATDGKNALEVYQSFRPEVCIIDIGLPAMDGYELASRIRDDYGNESHLIALTGYGRAADRRRALESGFDAHFVKPLDPNVFFQTIIEHQSRGSDDGRKE